MSSAKTPKNTPQEEELSAIIQLRQSPPQKDDTTGELDRVALERAEKTARIARKIEHKAAKHPPLRLIAIVLVVTIALGFFLAQSGWF